MSGVREWNTLSDEMRNITLWLYGFTTGPEGMQ